MIYGKLIIAVLVYLCCNSVYAQALPGSIDAGRVRERVPVVPDKNEDQPELVLPKAAPAPKMRPHVVENGMILRNMQITGATAFSRGSLIAAYRDYLGKPIDLYVLRLIAERITLRYQQAGYTLSKAFVPKQVLEGGVAHIAVVEGYVSTVRITGPKEVLAHDHLGIVEGAVARIKGMRPLYGPGLERQLLLLNDLGGVHVKAVLEPLRGAEALPGAVGMTLAFEKVERLSTVEVNNFGSRFSGPWQVTGGTSVGTPLMAFDALHLNGLVSLPLSEVKFFSGDYSVPLSASGLALTFGGSYANSEPGYTLKNKDIVSDAYTSDIALSFPLLRSRQENLSVSGRFDTSDTNTDALSTPLSHDRIRAVRATASFDNQDSFGGANTAVVTLSQGLNLLDATETGAKDLSRADGHSDFTKANLAVSRVQQLFRNWQGYFSANGQYAWAPLLSAEEFGYGGQAFGRAYDPSEIIGDSGLAGSLELRYQGIAPREKITLEPFGFYDIGKIWNVASSREGPDSSGSSAGLGLRFGYGLANGSLTAALPLTRPAYDPPSYSSHYGPRILLQTGVTF